MKGSSPNKVGPTYADTVPVRSGIPPTNVANVSPGSIRIGFATAWDFDNERLTYQIYRDKGTGSEKLVKTVTTNSNFWTVPTQYVTDTNVPAGNHTYQVRITDGFGNELLSAVSNPIAANDPQSAYAAQVTLDGADHYWRLGESAATTYDSAGGSDGTAGSGVTRGATGAIGSDVDKASTFNGTSSGYVGLGSTAVKASDNFTLEGWFKTTTVLGGKIAGYGSSRTGNSSNYDRHVYMSNNGRINFGVFRGTVKVLTTPTAYNDGQWHQFAATLSAGGMELYLDGRLIARDRGTPSGQNFNGYWRIGGDTLSSAWTNAPTSAYFSGTIDDVSTYPAVLSVAQINDHLVKSGRSSTLPNTPPADQYGAATYAAGPDFYWRLNESGGPVAADATSNDNRGIYSGSLTYGQPGAVTGTSDKSVGFLSNTTFLSSASNFVPAFTYTEEIWFKTNTIRGGKLLGFGSSQSQPSTNIDRNLTMTNAGKIRFGVLNGATQVVVESPLSYNNNAWHHAAATQSAEGMRLYVDGVLVGSDPNKISSSFTGYWRVGHDTVWAGSTNTNFVGQLDEVATYPRALTLQEIKSRYRKGGGVVANTPPIASFTFDAGGLNTSFSGVTSSDPDGSIASYAWNWGDGSTGSGVTAAHTYGAPGTYTVVLTVTDNEGGTTAVQQAITVANGAPTAGFEVTTNLRQVATDASSSGDSDGTIAAYSWNCGDGTPNGSGKNATHTYAANGTYTITLTVTDNAGGTATIDHHGQRGRRRSRRSPPSPSRPPGSRSPSTGPAPVIRTAPSPTTTGTSGTAAARRPPHRATPTRPPARTRSP